MNTSAPVIVFGESSASVFLIHELVKQNESVLWLNGSGTRLIPVMPYVKSEKALAVLLAAQHDLSEENEVRPLERGTFHRVFRNKSFQFPVWKKATSLEAQEESFEELMWSPEKTYLGVQEYRMGGLTPMQIESKLRTRYESHALVKKIQNTPIVEFEVFEHGGKVQFADGFITEFKQFFYCDSLNELRTVPKLAAVFKSPLSHLKSGHSMNALQVVFHHSAVLEHANDVGFVMPMNRDAGETFDRNCLGYFLDERTSVWTVFLKPSECEDNHDIMKKLRKLKQTLNRAFDSPEFMSTVEKEQVRFEENCLLVDSKMKVSQSNPDFVLLPDAFGISKALEAIAERFGIEAIEFGAFETEGHVNPVLAESDSVSVEMPARPETDAASPDL